MAKKLPPPIVDNKLAAQTSTSEITVSFLMNNSVGWEDFDNMFLTLRAIQSNDQLLILNCTKDAIIYKDGKFWVTFTLNPSIEGQGKDFNFQVGQYYKVQIAYSLGGIIGTYSDIATFKFTSVPQVTIQNLSEVMPTVHFYTYTGQYDNALDSSEKVYSYEFNLYDANKKLIATSGEQLHNSSTDTSPISSTDSWTVNFGLEAEKEYLISYKIKTINGLEYVSPSYRITDNILVDSNLFNYYAFSATNNPDSACVELSLESTVDLNPAEKKLINGKFVLLRCSSEDNFSTWRELTRFILSSWDVSQKKCICKDYCVSQGVIYKYGIQAYNDQNIYSKRKESEEIKVDFEDIFLSDGERQLKVKFNPKISSFKNTILESKMDTLGGKYPFFFRNGNVKYKEFPISGLISMLMDSNGEFVTGIQTTPLERETTPSEDILLNDLSTMLTCENYHKERNFKLEVLEWLTNGKPKLFRSPSEGSYIVRLMNTSLSPNDTLGRMLHTFSCTAYEIADFTFENLRKYGMMMQDYTETRELRIQEVDLKTYKTLYNLEACTATVNTSPTTNMYYRLKNDPYRTEVIVGSTGVYTFPNEVLVDNPLVEIGLVGNDSEWVSGSNIIYGEYINAKADNFSYLHSMTIEDKIEQWVGNNKNEVEERFDKYNLITSLGMIYYLSVQKRPIIPITSIEEVDGEWVFKIDDVVYNHCENEILYCSPTGQYYDGDPQRPIAKSTINYNFQLRKNETPIDLEGINIIKDYNLANILNCDSITNTGGRLILTNVKDVDLLYIGSGLYIDIAYQEYHKVYSVELEENTPLNRAKEQLGDNPSSTQFQAYYDLLVETLKSRQEEYVINAL